MNEELKKEITELVKELRQPDSLEIGNSKTGSIKVYGDFSKPEEFKSKLEAAVKLLKDNRDSVLGA